MKFSILLMSSLILLLRALQATVFITHGLGTEGIKYYQNSKYIDLIKESAQNLGHETICISWLEADSPAKGFAGILPQERISGAVKIAKEILNEIKSGNKIILIGHGYGGQVMACATRLLNPENAKLTDSFIYELIYSIKNSMEDSAEVDQLTARHEMTWRSPAFHDLSSQEQDMINQDQDLMNHDLVSQELTRTITPEAFLKTLIWGWKISKSVFDMIESSNIVNQNLIKLIKQNVSLEFIDEIKNTWKSAFNEVQSYKNKIFKDGKNIKDPKNIIDGFDFKTSIQTIYTIGTAYNGDIVFSPDMKVVQHHVNFYSSSDSILSLSGLSISNKKLAPRHPRTINIEVLFDPTKSFAPKHAEFCGNVLMAPWILLIPNELKTKNLGGFEKFEWGKSGIVTFYTKMIPSFQVKN